MKYNGVRAWENNLHKMTNEKPHHKSISVTTAVFMYEHKHTYVVFGSSVLLA